MNIKIKHGTPIILPVGVRGEKRNSVYMLLDTGARVTILSWNALEFCGYKPYIVKKAVPVTTANGVIHCPLIKVKEISIGKFKVKDIEVICHDIPELIRLEGLLGLNFIENFRVCIDYKKGCMELEK